MSSYKQRNILGLINIKNQNCFKVCCTVFGIKFLIKNKKGIDFYTKKRKELKQKLYQVKYGQVLDKLNSERKNKNPILTVFLLTYNHVETIEKCILSLLNQNTKFEYIIKILDDASNDGTTAICFEYAKKYPEKIEYILQPFNSKGMHFRKAIESVKTPYWSFIDGDDWWLTTDKIEKAISFLEKNKDYVVYGTNHLHKTTEKELDGIRKDKKNGKIINPITIQNYLLLHPSTRFHRRVIDYSKEFKEIKLTDFYIYITHLIKGLVYCEDNITSVYNYNNKGICSKLNDEQLFFWYLKYWYVANTLFDFEYDTEITKILNIKKLNLFKKIFGKRLGWKLYVTYKKDHLIKKEIKAVKACYQKIEKRHVIKKQGI